jgi:hypothetical protein
MQIVLSSIYSDKEAKPALSVWLYYIYEIVETVQALAMTFTTQRSSFFIFGNIILVDLAGTKCSL